MNLGLRQKLWSFGLIVAFFVGWQLFCILSGMSDLILPRPTDVLATLIARFPVLWPHIVQTLLTTMTGFALGVGLGVVLGAIIGISKVAYDTAYPLLVGFSSIPKVAVVPIFVLWFGSGSVPAILTALSICFFPIVVNIATGLATTEPELEGRGRSSRPCLLDSAFLAFCRTCSIQSIQAPARSACTLRGACPMILHRTAAGRNLRRIRPGLKWHPNCIHLSS